MTANNTDRRNLLTVALVALLAAMLLPELGCTLFNTKGEPREAIVAMSMLQQDNWILPTSCGGDIPYKPPMLAWCVAVFAKLFNGGEVNEFVARMPSAIAMTVMLTACFRYFARRGRNAIALSGVLLTATAFEVYRAGMTCRVDMLNTMFIVTAILALERWRERGLRGVPLAAIAMMTGAFLTKGPVGVALPCMVSWVTNLIMEPRRWWCATWRLTLSAVAASVVPLTWYFAAYGRGGERFMALVIEENFGRLTGSMSYDSHVNPAWYNVVTLVAGWLPWTLLMLLSLFGLRLRVARLRLNAPLWQLWHRLTDGLRRMSSARRLALLTSVLIFIFYCIPASKRSVYLLPVYPFIGYLMAVYVSRMCIIMPRIVRGYAVGLGVVAIAAQLLMTVLLATGGAGIAAGAVADIVSYRAGVVQLMTMLLPAAMGVVTLVAARRRGAVSAMRCAIYTVAALYVTFGSLYSPAALNARSDRGVAMSLTRHAGQEPVYSYASDRLIRFYTIGFYSDDRVRRLDIDIAAGNKPDTGIIIVAERDTASFNTFNSSLPAPYSLELLRKTDRKSCDLRSPLLIYRFKAAPRRDRI